MGAGGGGLFEKSKKGWNKTMGGETKILKMGAKLVQGLGALKTNGLVVKVLDS